MSQHVCDECGSIKHRLMGCPICKKLSKNGLNKREALMLKKIGQGNKIIGGVKKEIYSSESKSLWPYKK